MAEFPLAVSASAGSKRGVSAASCGFAEFMKADNEDNGKALKSLGLAK
ncbi:hypothetical protein ACFIOY_24695 [Bradyrhizobium sp. TZ2]